MSLKELARNLRTNATDAERKLWRRLRRKQLDGCRFRRQVVIEPYIVDFACFEVKIIIEVDGGQHQNNEDYDVKRDNDLVTRGFNILRFWNNDVLENIEAVILKIEEQIKESKNA